MTPRARILLGVVLVTVLALGLAGWLQVRRSAQEDLLGEDLVGEGGKHESSSATSLGETRRLSLLGETSRQESYARKLSALRRHRSASQPAGIENDADREHGMTEARATMMLAQQFGPLMSACHEDLTDASGGGVGHVELKVQIVGSPDIGAVAEGVTATVQGAVDPALTQCLSESLFLVELDDPVAPLETTITIGAAFPTAAANPAPLGG